MFAPAIPVPRADRPRRTRAVWVTNRHRGPWIAISALVHGAVVLAGLFALASPPVEDAPARLELALTAASVESVPWEAAGEPEDAIETPRLDELLAGPVIPEDEIVPDDELPPPSSEVAGPRIAPSPGPGLETARLRTRSAAPPPEPVHAPVRPARAVERPMLATAASVRVDGAVPLAGNLPPPYPSEARARRWRGRVELAIEIGADGRVAAVSVLTSSGHALLDDAAVRAVLEWRFVPAMRGGTPVASTRTQAIRFAGSDEP